MQTKTNGRTHQTEASINLKNSQLITHHQVEIPFLEKQINNHGMPCSH
jgi:hypothetical protein